MPTLNDIMYAMGGVDQEIMSSALRAQENAQKSEAAANRISDTLKTVADDSALVTQVQKTAELKAQQATTKAAASAGVDPNAASDIISQTLGKLNSANQETLANLATYRAKSEINPFEHPIDYIVGQITLPFAEERLKGSLQQSQILSDQLAKVNQALQQSSVTYNQIKESTTAASVEASARIASADAKIKAEQAAIEGFKFNTQGVQAVAQASQEVLTNLFHAKNAQQAEVQTGIALENLKLHQEEFEWRKQEKKAQDEAKAEQRGVDENIIEKINLSRASFGLTPIAGLEAKQAVQMLKAGASKDMAYHYENGDRIKATGQSFIGSTPAESVNALNQIPSNLSEARKETAKLLSEAQAALSQNKTIDPKDKGARDQFINNYVKESVKQQYNNISPGSGNLFDVGDLKEYLNLRSTADLGITKKFLGPLATTGQPLNDPKIVLGLAQKAVEEGKLTSTEFQQLSTVYQAASQITQQVRGFTGFGIVLPNNGKNYYAKMGTFSGKLDLTNPTELGRYLMKQKSEGLFEVLGSIVRDPLNTGKPVDLSFGPKLTYPAKVRNIYE